MQGTDHAKSRDTCKIFFYFKGNIYIGGAKGFTLEKMCVFSFH